MDENPAPPASAAATDAMTGTEQPEPGTSVASTAAASSHEDGEGAAAAAEPSDGSSKTVSEQIASLLWGGKIKPDVFRRWLQGNIERERERGCYKMGFEQESGLS